MPSEKSKPNFDRKRPAEFWKRFGGGTAGALLAIIAGVALLYLKFGLGLIHLSYDLPYAIRPVIQPKEAVMVYLDDDSHRELNQPYNAPWDRSLHARLLDRLTAEGAKAVVFDIVFSDAGANPAADEALAKAIRTNGRVVLAADYVPTGYGRDGVAAKEIVPPFEMFVDAAAALGTAEIYADDDLVPRQHEPISRDDQIPGMSWAAAKIAGAKIADDDNNRLVPRWLNYYGPATTIPNVSFYQAMATNSDMVPAGFFSNQVVFVGARLLTKFSGERKDEYPTPHSRWAKKYPFMPGAEIQATQFLNLLHGDWLDRLPQKTELAILIFTGLLLGFGLVRFHPFPATGIAILLAALAAVLAYLSFAHLHLWFPWLLVLVQIFIALAWSVVFNSIQLYVQKKLLEQALARYLSPKLVKKFARQPDVFQRGAKSQSLTFLFSDLQGFTTITEGMAPEVLSKMMNNYFEIAVTECIHRTDGTIVQYVGDAIYAFWNAPEPQSNHAIAACRAALLFRDQNIAGRPDGKPLYTRIGLHTGIANVGNYGSATQVYYTALGENVNLTARMESLNKYLGTRVLITGETKAEIGDQLVTRPLGRFRLKGFHKTVEVLELVGTLEAAEATRPLREAFAVALKLFHEKKFAEAEAAFQKILETNPQDGPTKYFLHLIAELPEHPLPDDWNGEVELKEK